MVNKIRDTERGEGNLRCPQEEMSLQPIFQLLFPTKGRPQASSRRQPGTRALTQGSRGRQPAPEETVAKNKLGCHPQQAASREHPRPETHSHLPNATCQTPVPARSVAKRECSGAISSRFPKEYVIFSPPRKQINTSLKKVILLASLRNPPCS